MKKLLAAIAITALLVTPVWAGDKDELQDPLEVTPPATHVEWGKYLVYNTQIIQVLYYVTADGQVIDREEVRIVDVFVPPTFACDDPRYETLETCEVDKCSDPQYVDKKTCEDAGEEWIKAGKWIMTDPGIDEPRFTTIIDGYDKKLEKNIRAEVLDILELKLK